MLLAHGSGMGRHRNKTCVNRLALFAHSISMSIWHLYGIWNDVNGITGGTAALALYLLEDGVAK